MSDSFETSPDDQTWVQIHLSISIYIDIYNQIFVASLWNFNAPDSQRLQIPRLYVSTYLGIHKAKKSCLLMYKFLYLYVFTPLRLYEPFSLLICVSMQLFIYACIYLFIYMPMYQCSYCSYATIHLCVKVSMFQHNYS